MLPEESFALRQRVRRLEARLAELEQQQVKEAELRAFLDKLERGLTLLDARLAGAAEELVAKLHRALGDHVKPDDVKVMVH